MKRPREASGYKVFLLKRRNQENWEGPLAFRIVYSKKVLSRLRQEFRMGWGLQHISITAFKQRSEKAKQRKSRSSCTLEELHGRNDKRKPQSSI